MVGNGCQLAAGHRCTSPTCLQTVGAPLQLQCPSTICNLTLTQERSDLQRIKTSAVLPLKSATATNVTTIISATTTTSHNKCKWKLRGAINGPSHSRNTGMPALERLVDIKDEEISFNIANSNLDSKENV